MSRLSSKNGIDKRIIVFSLIVAVCLITVFYVISIFKSGSTLSLSTQSQRQADIYIGQTEVLADIADTPDSREKGLGGRTGLGDNEGMLFEFPKPDYYGFWMKDMKFSIDMVWLDANLNVVSIQEDVLPSSYPEVFKPQEPALYVLEVPSGFTLLHDIKIGDAAKILSESVK